MLWLLWGFCLLVFHLGKQPILLLHVTKNKQMGGRGEEGRGRRDPPFLTGKAIKICCIRNYPSKNTNKHKALLQLEARLATSFMGPRTPSALGSRGFVLHKATVTL